MKLQRIFICIAGVFFAVGFAASQAAAGTGVPGCGTLGVGSPPMGIMEIEVNALRAGGKTIVTSPNDTTKVTAKARIRKGTAASGTTMVTGLTIEAFDGEVSVGQGSASNITLGVGKGQGVIAWLEARDIWVLPPDGGPAPLSLAAST